MMGSFGVFKKENKDEIVSIMGIEKVFSMSAKYGPF
jgi:hypothetical protein